MSRLVEFIATLWLYRRNPKHAARIAYEIVYKGAPF